MGSAFNWPCQVGNLLQQSEVGSDTSSVYGISALVSQTSFRGKPVVGVAKCRLFSKANFAAKAKISRETHKH